MGKYWRWMWRLFAFAIVMAAAAGFLWPFLVYPPSWQAAYRTVGPPLSREVWEHVIHDKVNGIDYIGPIEGALEREGKPIICPHCDCKFIWMTHPPCGRRIPVQVNARADQMFYACCSRPGKDGRRLFVFSDIPNGMISDIYQLLKDEEVSWFFQKRRGDLTAEERMIERERESERQ